MISYLCQQDNYLLTEKLIIMTLKIAAIIFAALFNVAFISKIDYLTADPSSSYIYGTVYTDDNEEYTGQIRWGKEEAFWFDFFNSSKPDNDYLDYLSRSEVKALNGNRRGLGRNWSNGTKWISWNNGNHSNGHTHSFAIQFGNIQSIEMGRRDRIKLHLKNGDEIKLEGGSNDIETYVQVSDQELGHIKIDWDRIDKVVFKSSPSNIDSYYGPPLYGTVKTEGGETFTGFVQWDHDERLAKDELNGKSRDGEIDMEFGNIAKIIKTFRGSQITTHSGRELELKGTNDVNDENRGIIVNLPGEGRVDIPWDEFDEVVFTEMLDAPVRYEDFKGDK